MNKFLPTLSVPVNANTAHAGGKPSPLRGGYQYRDYFGAISKTALLSLMLAGALVAKSAVAAGAHDMTQGSTQDYAQGEYLSEPLECTVMEVATQYESGAHEAVFHCIEDEAGPDSMRGRIFELEGLPADFKDKYRDKLNSLKERLRAASAQANPGKDNRLANSSAVLTRKAKRMMRAKLRATNIYRSQDSFVLTRDTQWSMTEDAQSIDEAIADAANTAEIAEAISATDESTVLVLHITALDSHTSASPSELSDSVFGTFGDPVNLASQYNACSYGKKTFLPATGADIVDGVAQITIGINAVGASRTTVMNAATNAANTLLGSLSGQFDHVMYALPPGTADSWIAYGYFNYYPTVYNDNWATKVSAQMHEVGHNLYLQHSNEGASNYADQQGMMGYSYNQDDGPVMCFNAAKSSQLSWYNDKEITIDHSWTGKVIGLADYTQASPEQNVILKAQGADNSFLYVTYNRQSGINSGTREAGNQVTVVQGANRQSSNLLAKLGSNGSYTLPGFWPSGNDFEITVDEISTDFNNIQYAMVSIDNGDDTPAYQLIVNNGSGDGNYNTGAIANITANAAPSGQEFDSWVVNSGGVVIADADAASTTLVMPANAVEITASYKDQPPASYPLLVNSGSGDGSYASGAVVNINAAAAPAGQLFDRWVVNSGAAVIADISAASTTLVMPSNAATITATYKNTPAASYALTVNNGSGDGSYVSGALANITADTAPAGQEFDHWVVNAGGAVIADGNAASTALIMPSNAATITATYKQQPPASYALTVNNGSGGGSYVSGAVANITANAAPSGHEFDSWVVNSGGAVIADSSDPSTTLIMADGAATVTAEFKELVIDTPKAEQGIVTGVSSSSWKTVNLSKSYSSMVVVATPNYSIDSNPAVVRIRNASGSSFQVKMSAASSGTVSNVAVHYLVVEEGVYESPKMEARKVVSDGTNGRRTWSRTLREEYSYGNTYTKPVVLGQVMTHNDPDFSVFFASRVSRKRPPTATVCYVGKHVAEDPDKTRASETLGVIVMESGSGVLDGVAYTAAQPGPKSVSGVGDAPPYSYPSGGLANPAIAILSMAAIKGGNGGWPILYGSNPVTANAVNVAVDEDTLGDAERSHDLEKLAYIVFDSQ
jgi:Gametolysin peptidase M11/Divergent InlB B-repeat domain